MTNERPVTREELEKAAIRLADAADAVGIKYFDGDNECKAVIEMQEATLALRDITHKAGPDSVGASNIRTPALPAQGQAVPVLDLNFSNDLASDLAADLAEIVRVKYKVTNIDNLHDTYASFQVLLDAELAKRGVVTEQPK